jgi:type IV secretory pathway VirB2 component (pilin)
VLYKTLMMRKEAAMRTSRPRRPRCPRRPLRIAALALATTLLAAHSALAGTGGEDMPWNTPFQKILDNITGPTGKVIAGLLIAIGGIVWGATRHEQGVSRIFQAIFAIGLILGATTLVTTLGFQGCTF